jgi:hypothetical protein
MEAVIAGNKGKGVATRRKMVLADRANLALGVNNLNSSRRCNLQCCWAHCHRVEKGGGRSLSRKGHHILQGYGGSLKQAAHEVEGLQKLCCACSSRRYPIRFNEQGDF